MMIIAWLAAFIIFIIMEAVTFQLITIWFAAGSLAAMFAAILHASIELQLILFLIGSFVLLFTLRPFLNKYIKGSATKTNVDSLIGMTAKVTARINNRDGFGKAVVRGQEWTAIAEEEEEVIEAGTMVTIVGISGVKLIVKKQEKEKTYG